jgi:hypothetical protein
MFHTVSRCRPFWHAFFGATSYSSPYACTNRLIPRLDADRHYAHSLIFALSQSLFTFPQFFSRNHLVALSTAHNLASTTFLNACKPSHFPPSPPRFRQFWRAVIWAIVFLIVLIFIHTVAFALWRARAKTFAPGVLFFPRFELFLVAVTVAGIANSSAFIIAGDSAWGLGLGLTFLVLWPVLFVGWLLLFLLIKVVRVSQPSLLFSCLPHRGCAEQSKEPLVPFSFWLLFYLGCEPNELVMPFVFAFLKSQISPPTSFFTLCIRPNKEPVAGGIPSCISRLPWMRSPSLPRSLSSFLIGLVTLTLCAVLCLSSTLPRSFCCSSFPRFRTKGTHSYGQRNTTEQGVGRGREPSKLAALRGRYSTTWATVDVRALCYFVDFDGARLARPSTNSCFRISQDTFHFAIKSPTVTRTMKIRKIFL